MLTESERVLMFIVEKYDESCVEIKIFNIGPSFFGVVTNCHSPTKPTCRCQIGKNREVVAILVEITM